MIVLKEEKTYKPPQGATSSAKKALDWRDEHGRDEVKGGTRVGWTRANQLKNRENLSLDTVKRIHSFFSRHKGNEKVDPKYKDEPWKDKGYISFLIWGGNSAKDWTKEIANNNRD